MQYLIPSFVTVLLVIGIISSYFDLKKGVIPNKLIFWGFAMGVLLYLFFFFYNIFYLQSAALHNYLPAALLNGIIAILVGYALWSFKFWSAGDGKLFGLYGFLLPLEFYSKTYVDYFPGFVILVNLFIPLLLLMFFKLLISMFRKREKLYSFVNESQFWKKKNLLKLLGKIFGIFLDLLLVIVIIRFIFVFFARIGMPINGFLVFFMLIAAVYGFNKLKVKWPKIKIIQYTIIIIYFGRLLVEGDFQSVVLYLRMVVFFMIFLGLLRKVLLFYVQNEETKMIPAAQLKEGMILTKQWKKYFQEKISKMNKNDKHIHFRRLGAEGLTARQAEIFKELFFDDPKFKVEICNVIPFAPFLLLSALISITTSSSFLPLFDQLLKNIIYF